MVTTYQTRNVKILCYCFGSDWFVDSFDCKLASGGNVIKIIDRLLSATLEGRQKTPAIGKTVQLHTIVCR